MVVVTVTPPTAEEMADQMQEQRPTMTRATAIKKAHACILPVEDGALAYVCPKLSGTRPMLIPKNCYGFYQKLGIKSDVAPLGMCVTRVNRWQSSDTQTAVQCTGVCMPDSYQHIHPLAHTHSLRPFKVDYTMALGQPVTYETENGNKSNKLLRETYTRIDETGSGVYQTDAQTQAQRMSWLGKAGAWTSLGRQSGVRIAWGSMPVVLTKDLEQVETPDLPDSASLSETLSQSERPNQMENLYVDYSVREFDPSIEVSRAVDAYNSTNPTIKLNERNSAAKLDLKLIRISDPTTVNETVEEALSDIYFRTTAILFLFEPQISMELNWDDFLEEKNPKVVMFSAMQVKGREVIAQTFEVEITNEIMDQLGIPPPLVKLRHDSNGFASNNSSTESSPTNDESLDPPSI